MSKKYEIEERTAQPVVAVWRTVPAELTDEIGTAIGDLIRFLERNGIEPAGPPYSRTTWEPGTELEVGVPVAKALAASDDVVSGELPGGRVAVALHKGPHETIRETVTALEEWVEAQGHEVAGVPWEIYLTNPREVENPEEWEQQVVVPVG